MSPRDDDTTVSRITSEPRHWIEYGVFAFVILTAIATATAAWYTRREWESSVDNGHRQLRAYVFPDQAKILWQGTSKPMAAEIVIKNSGQTPAYRLSSATAVLVADWPLQADLRTPKMPPNHTVLPPSSASVLSALMDKPLTTEQLKGIQKGTQAIYAFGEIAYEDAFSECRLTRYRFYYASGTPDLGAKIDLSYLDEGNMETSCPGPQ